MQRIELSYNPYKMKTVLTVDGIDVCQSSEDYGQFKEFIETNTPLQTWIEPIEYKHWKGIIDELKADEEGFDILDFHFHGREIDFQDLKRVCETENAARIHRLEINFVHDTKYSDEKLAQNIDVIMESLLSDRFAKLVEEQGKDSEAYLDYQNLEENYNRAKQKEFKIVFAGLYSSGKSTILNALVRHNVLPTSDKTCTAKTCRIRHVRNLESAVTLECFDKEGNVVVPKEKYSSDVECLEKFWEITPLGSNDSVPKTVDTIELCMNLSHLYPSREMEKIFNLVIIDTPGCNSRKKITKFINQKNEYFENADKKLALDTITNGDREMVVICADAQDYDDESLGDFLKAIHEALNENIGDFNDRFLFVLNKCDALKFNRNETIVESKNDFANYLMDTRRWGIIQGSFKFVPRIFMLSAYNYFALAQGVSHFSEEEIDESEEKQNLSDAYDDFCKKVIKRKNPNYFLSQVCDIPDYRKNQFEIEFENSLEKDADRALKIQTGVCCIESAIQDYIARYAYPLKVKSLIETFDLLLESVKDFSDFQKSILDERMENMGKHTTEREEVELKKEDEEEKEAALRRLKGKVESEKAKIMNITLDLSNLQTVRADIDVKIEANSSIKRVRKAEGNEKFTVSELKALTANIEKVFDDAEQEVDKTFSEITAEYKEKITEICTVLNEVALELQNFNINGYDFSSSLALKKLQVKDTDSLVKEIQKTKQEKSAVEWITKRNPIKDIEYKRWQIFHRIRQYFASENIEIEEEVTWNEYSLASLKTYVTEISGAFKKLSTEAEKDYNTEITTMTTNASRMADAVVRDINSIVKKIEEYRIKIESLGNNIEELQDEINTCNSTIKWLEQIAYSIEEGGRFDD